MTPGTIVAEIQELFAEHGGESYGESVTILQHSLLTAAAAEARGADDALIVACLLHDIGHFIGEPDDEYGHHAHDRTAARYLADRFDRDVVEPIRLHVSAKRYLCAVEPEYVNELSEPSRRSLEKQGGPMSAAETAEFQADPYAESAIALRQWEDRYGKDGTSARPPELAYFLPLTERMAAQHRAAPGT